MNKETLINYWEDVAMQNADKLRTYFLPEAYIRWNNTNEQFTVDEFIIANCEYPGDWCAKVERLEQIEDTFITVANVWLTDKSASFHVCSFFEFKDNKISVLNEYWGDDGAAPQWRLDKNIGKPIITY